jgi:hypothetical protein
MMTEEQDSSAVVARDVATADIERWLDARRMKQAKRNANKDQIDGLIEAVMDGELEVNDQNELVQILAFPFEADGGRGFDQLVYKNRLKPKDVDFRGGKQDDANHIILCYASALTGKTKPILQELETSDFRLIRSIASFFL